LEGAGGFPSMILIAHGEEIDSRDRKIVSTITLPRITRSGYDTNTILRVSFKYNKSYPEKRRRNYENFNNPARDKTGGY
jgi:hypothetical protein